MLIVPNACMPFGEHPKSVGVHREIRHVETLVLVCGNNKKSPISSTKLHKIKTAEPILADVSADIELFYAMQLVTPIVVAIAVSMLISN